MIWILLAIVIALILFLWLRPYFIKYNTTLCFTGEMGAGKTYKAVDTAVKQYKKNLFSIKFHNLIRKLLNKVIKHHNKKITFKASNPKRKHIGKIWKERELQQLPRLISNIPIRIKGGKHELWSNVLTKEMLILTKDKIHALEKIPEYSIIVIDELPQLVDQFNWDLEEVQNNLNEFITFLRHYINGLLIITAQSIDQVVKPIRQKMNTFYWLSNWRKFLFFFYKVDVCQFISSELVANVNTGFIEDNTKTNYGILHKHRYDSRCYSERYTQQPDYKQFKRWSKYKTKRIIRFDDYNSPLDPPKNKAKETD